MNSWLTLDVFSVELAYLFSSLFTGVSLKQLEADCRLYVEQMVQFSRQVIADESCLMWQLIHNLVGFSMNTTILTGECMDQTAFEKKYPGHTTCYLELGIWRQFACTYFGEYEVGAELAMERSNDRYINGMYGHVPNMFDVFYRCQCLYAASRIMSRNMMGRWRRQQKKQNQQRKKYQKEAKRLRKMLNNWARNGNPNVLHLCKIVDAEHYALIGNHEKAFQFYHEAIVLSSRSGFIHDSALANERYGDTLLEVFESTTDRSSWTVDARKKNSQIDQRSEAMLRYLQSKKLYEEWGAMKKVSLLSEHLHDL